MHNYILESMAQVGCGASDTREISEIVNNMTAIQRDTLDAMHNFGIHTTLTPVASATRQRLISDYSIDELECFAAYVNASRSVGL